MGHDEDERPRPASTHQIGQDLSLLSVAECEARIAALRDEIGPIEAALARKQATREAAHKFFK